MFVRLLVVFGIAASCSGATVSPLLARGYTVLPAPRQVKLGEHDFSISAAWRLEGGDSLAAQTLREKLAFTGQANAGTVRLEIAPGSVTPGASQDEDRSAIAAQAYRIELTPKLVRIVANAAPGLFYGAETLVQLIKRRDGMLWLPEGEITDWPDLRLRAMYWDDAHHLEKIPELKRAIRQAAYFKINGFELKLEGHFQYAHAPALVEPYALSPAELQELTNYGLRYFVQVIPYLDSPGHIAFILKHPEYAPLREYPDSNYEACATNPEFYKLLYGMFDDLLAANQGVKYFVLSTDEPYYIGMAENAQCQEGKRARELGGVGKVFAEFVTKAGGYLNKQGRTVVFWGEYPLKPGDIASLPNFVVNGETYGHGFDPLYQAQGIRQMIYTSTEGEEKMFPQYFMRPASQRIHPEHDAAERVEAALATIVDNPARQDAELTGVMVAGWADMGLHPETFWLGYASVTAAGWNPQARHPSELMSTFYPLFFGPEVERMDRVYQLMSYQAQLWNDTWDTGDSKARKPIWGNSTGIFNPPHPAHDQLIPLLPAPGPDLSYAGSWSSENVKRVRAAEDGMPESDELLTLLTANLAKVKENRYTLEVFLSIAGLYRQNLQMLQQFHRMDALLMSAQSAARKQDAQRAVDSVDQALSVVRRIREERNSALSDATETWYKSWRPRVEAANGRRFVHELDDVKDHLPDRTIGMEYLVYRELLLPLDDWYGKVESARNAYAKAHGIAAREEPLKWKVVEK